MNSDYDYSQYFIFHGALQATPLWQPRCLNFVNIVPSEHGAVQRWSEVYYQEKKNPLLITGLVSTFEKTSA